MISPALRPPERISPDTRASPLRPPPRKATVRCPVSLIRPPMLAGRAADRRVPQSSRGDARAQDLQELPYPRLAPLGHEGPAMDQPGVELLAPQDVLEPLGQPVEHRGDHLGVDVLADLAPADAALDALRRPVSERAPHQPIAGGPPAAPGHPGVSPTARR